MAWGLGIVENLYLPYSYLIGVTEDLNDNALGM
jgi:hypothetical protein